MAENASPGNGGSSPPVVKTQGDKPPLNDLMLAMDVVDTLRHRQQMVERELSEEEREEALIERIRDIYAKQGIEVPEHVIQEGVAALKEQRFTYEPPPESFQIKLARLYVDRAKWAKRLMWVALLALVLWGAWYMLVTRPAQQKLLFEVGHINGQIMLTDQQLDQAADRAEVLAEELAKVRAQVSGDAAQIRQQMIGRGAASLTEAERLIAEARTLDQAANIDSDNLDKRGDAALSQVERQRALADQADQSLEQTAGLLSDLGSISELPGQLAALRDQVMSVARVDVARTQATELYDDGMGELSTGNVTVARQRVSDLRALADQLNRSYELKIVSRPGVRSGVWRVPDANRSARNFYLIVEALDDNGRSLALPITSEETGQTQTVTQWGVRVSERAFNRVRDDKSDDGIIQRDVVGEKKRGYLEPDYQMDITGGAITSW